MDKSDSRLHYEQMEKSMAKGDYLNAVFVADKVDWRKEEDNKKLIQAADVYRKNKRYDDAINILKIAHNRKPNNKKVVYLLCEIYFEKKDVVTAQVYLDRFQSMTDRSDWHYDALKYKRALAYDLPVSEKIDILQELKKKEPAAEKFRYELAVLLQKARQYAECAAECDELLILFGDDGTYARKSLELKKSCVALSDDQEDLLRRLSLGDIPGNNDEHAVEMMNTMAINSSLLEKQLANDVQNLQLQDDRRGRKKSNLNVSALEQTVLPNRGEIFFQDKTENMRPFTTDMPTIADDDLRSVDNDMKEIIYSDNVDEFGDPIEEEKIPGQVTMDELMSDWTKIKQRNTEDMKKSIHQLVEQTGKIFEKKKDEEVVEETEPAGSIWDEVDRFDEFDNANYEGQIDDQIIADAKAEGFDSEDIDRINEEDSVAEETIENEEVVEAEEAVEETVEETVPEEMVEEEIEEEAAYEELSTPEYEEAKEQTYEEATEEPEDSYDEEPDLDVVIKNEEEEELEEEEVAEEDNKVADLSPEEKKLFGPFLYSRQMKSQIINALENISLASYEGNIIITCDNKESGFALAKAIVKFMKYADSNFTGAMSKISSEKFNVKNVSEVMNKLSNGALVIEEANKLSNNSLIKLTQCINQEDRGILLFLVDSRKEIKHLLNRQRTLTDFFNIRIDIIAMSEDSLVDYGMKYANNLGYSIEEGFANLAFHKRVREAQAGNRIMTVADVKEIVDEAIERNGKNFVSKFARKVTGKLEDDNGMIMLREKDFN